jgi:uncharacterized protein (DUF488 family)
VTDGDGDAPVIYTVGYSGKTLDAFALLLRDAGVDRVVDVRALPLSRRKGFSKRPLAEALERHGISYVHLRAAGNPFRAIKADFERCLRLYASHLNENPSVLDEVEVALAGHRAALLCVEAEPEHCHRSTIAAHLAARNPRWKLRHL